jgi:hypothetical protein
MEAYYIHLNASPIIVIAPPVPLAVILVKEISHD